MDEVVVLVVSHEIPAIKVQQQLQKQNKIRYTGRIRQLPIVTFALSISGGTPAGISSTNFKFFSSSVRSLAGVQVIFTWKGSTSSLSKKYSVANEKAGKGFRPDSCPSVLSAGSCDFSLIPANCNSLSSKVSSMMTMESANEVWNPCEGKQQDLLVCWQNNKYYTKTTRVESHRSTAESLHSTEYCPDLSCVKI